MVHTTGSNLLVGHVSRPNDIVFTKADAIWLHYPHIDALVITIQIANSLVHWLLVDGGSTINILY